MELLQTHAVNEFEGYKKGASYSGFYQTYCNVLKFTPKRFDGIR